MLILGSKRLRTTIRSLKFNGGVDVGLPWPWKIDEISSLQWGWLFIELWKGSFIVPLRRLNHLSRPHAFL